MTAINNNQNFPEELVVRGTKRILWAQNRMTVLSSIADRWKKDKPLKGKKIAACLHVTAKTANLLITLKEGGADVALCASNPLSTQDDIVASLNKTYGVTTLAKHGEDTETFFRRINETLDLKPNLTIDDGADLVNTLHTDRKELLPNIIGGTEETTTGVNRLKAMSLDGQLKYPIIAVNDAMTKHMFDNRYGTGQSTIDGIMRATNYLLAGSNFVVVGYGWCGRGIARRASGMGAHITIVEADPIKALEATLDGFKVAEMSEAARDADFVVTATGNINVVDTEHIKNLKDGSIISNAGHFNVEINLKSLENMSKSIEDIKDGIKKYTMENGKCVHVIGEGRLVNLAAGEGHPADVMDMSFSNQALSVQWLNTEGSKLENKVYSVPEHLDREVASLKLQSMGIKHAKLTAEQEKYLNSWDVGTT